MTLTPEQIKSWRKREGLTQKDAAKVFRCRVRQYQNFESGEQTVSALREEVIKDRILGEKK